MVRFSVTLDETQNKWVEQIADDLNGSKTQVISMLVDRARDGEISLSGPTNDVSTDDHQDLDTMLSSLEERLSAVEAVVHTSPDSDSSMSRPVQNETTNYRSSGDAPVGGAPVPDDAVTELDSEQNPHGSPSVESTGNDQESSSDSLMMSEDDPELHAIREFIRQHSGDVATEAEIVSCWKFLKKRGTAGPKAFKRHCFPDEPTDEEELSAWWEDGVYPILSQLPGIEPPDGEGQLLRYRY